MTIRLSRSERRAIAGMKRLAKEWPDTLWVYADGDALHIHRTKPDGRRADHTIGDCEEEYIIDSIAIPNDGGRTGP